MLSVTFVTSSLDAVVMILKGLCQPDVIDQWVKKGLIKKDIDNKGFSFSPPPAETESFADLVKDLVAMGILIPDDTEDSESTNGEGRKYKILCYP